MRDVQTPLVEVTVAPPEADDFAAAHPCHRGHPERRIKPLFRHRLKECPHLSRIPCLEIACRICSGRLRQIRDVANQPIATDSLSDRLADDAVHVADGRRAERPFIPSAGIQQVRVERVELVAGELLEPHVA